jgi:hypothetical protein
MIAKRFFFVCAGISLLAVCFHFGARSATATGVGLEGPEFSGENSNTYVTFSMNRIMSGYSFDGAAYVALPLPSGPVPGTDEIVATRLVPGGDSGTYFALLANGDIYDAAVGSGEPAWVYRGNLAGQTPAERVTWGSVKARYR